ncbi:MAG: hypothetical protein ACPG32_05370 [Akkermansiaceae bacterium]
MITACQNPFATDRVQRVLPFDVTLTNTTWDELWQRWKLLNGRATVIGPHGAGKTTFLDSWEKLLQEKNHTTLRVFLNRKKRKFSSREAHALENSHGKIIILDGEEQLGWHGRRTFKKHTQDAAGVLITRHTPNNQPELLRLQPDIDCLIQCVQRIAPDQFSSLEKALPELWEKHHGNIRHVLLECYDLAFRLI